MPHAPALPDWDTIVPYLHANEIDIYYEDHGDPAAPALVLAHGAGGNHFVWWQQVPPFAERYRVITFDHRAFGFTRDVPGGPGRRAFALDLHALLDHLDVERFAIVAHSMGGRTATPFAWQFPGRIQALVLSGTLGGAVTDDVRAIQEAHAQRVEGQTLRQRALADHTRTHRPDLAWLYQRLNALNPRRPRTFLAPSPGMSRWRGSSMPLLRRLGLPVCFVVGQHDMIVPSSAVRTAHEAMPGSRFVEIANAGHSAYFEQPQAYNRAVLGFLADVWPPRADRQTAAAGR